MRKLSEKGQIVAEYSEILILLVEEGINDPKIEQMVERYINENMVTSGSSRLKADLFTSEKKDVRKYFTEIVKKASEIMGDLPYHYVTANYYKCRGKPFPEAKDLLRKQVHAFGVGRTTGDGVRFIRKGQEHIDMLFSLVAELRIKNNNDLGNATAKIINGGVQAGALGTPRKIPSEKVVGFLPGSKLK